MNLRTLLLATLTLVVLFLLIFNLMWFKEGRMCTSNPLIYGARRYSEANQEEFSCNCRFMGINNNLLIFNRTHLVTNPKTENINWSNIIIEE